MPPPTQNGTSRRDLAAASLALGLGGAAGLLADDGPRIVETNVEVKTPDGSCDAAFFHPAKGAHPGVLIWHDSLGLRPAMRELGRRIAAEGYSVLVPNLFYRVARAPVFDDSFDYANNAADRERYGRIVKPFLAPGAAERDAVAYVAFLNAQRQVNRRKKIGTHGYCLGGPYVLKTAAALPDRIGAGASFHGGFLVTKFAAAFPKDRAEIEVYPNAEHGWCVPDSKAISQPDADRALAKLVALYRAAL